MKGMCTEKIRTVSKSGAKNIAFLYFFIYTFCSLTDRPTYKIFIEQMLIYESNLHKKIRTPSLLGAEKIVFPPKSDIRTDRHTDGQTYG